MNGKLLQRLRERLKILSSLAKRSELLTSEIRMQVCTAFEWDELQARGNQ